MSESKSFISKFLSIVVGVIGLHVGLVALHVFPVDFFTILKLDVVLLVLYAAGALIMAPGLMRHGESFVNRFLILTTVQMLAMMGVIAALAYVKLKGALEIGFHTVSVFLILLIIQSYFLVKNSNSTVDKDINKGE
ncbi:MAG: hypothetical protein JKY09_06790 [Crocinitomicaceae bacterium]|nr:hypothetical protein [Crocinitomicaceae bacterium]